MSTKARRILGEENVPIHYAVSESPKYPLRRLSMVTISSTGDNTNRPISASNNSMVDTVNNASQTLNRRRTSFYVGDQKSDSQTLLTPIAGLRTPRLSSALHSHPNPGNPLNSFAPEQSLDEVVMEHTLRRNSPSTPNLRSNTNTLSIGQPDRPVTAMSNTTDSTSDIRVPKSRFLSLFSSKNRPSRPSQRAIPRSNPFERSPIRTLETLESTDQLSVIDSTTLKSMSSQEGFTALASDTTSEFSPEQVSADTPVIKGGPSTRFLHARDTSIEEAARLSPISSTFDQELYVSEGGISHERPRTALSLEPQVKSLNAEALARLEASSISKPSTLGRLLPEKNSGKSTPQPLQNRSRSRKNFSIAQSVSKQESFFAFSDSEDNEEDPPKRVVPSVQTEEDSGEVRSVHEEQQIKRSTLLYHPNPRSRWSPSTIPSTVEYPRSNRTSWISSSPTVYHPAPSNIESLASSLSSLRNKRKDESKLMAVTEEEAAFLSSMRRKRASIRRHLVTEGYRLAVEEEYRKLSQSRQRSTSRTGSELGGDIDVESRVDEALSTAATDSPLTAFRKAYKADTASPSPPRGRPTSIKITTTARLSDKPGARSTALEEPMWRDLADDLTETEDDSPIHPTHRRTQGDFAPLNSIINSKVDDSDEDVPSTRKIHHRKRLSKLLGVTHSTSSSWWNNQSEEELFYTPPCGSGKMGTKVEVIDAEAERKKLAKNKKKRHSAVMDILAAWGELGGE